MMSTPFNRIGLFAKHNNKDIQDTFQHVIAFLKKRQHSLIIEHDSAVMLNVKQEKY